MKVNHNNKRQVNAAIVATLALGALSGLMGTGLIGPFRARFTEFYGISQAGFGTALAVIGIVLGIIGIWQGPKLADRIGRFRVLKMAAGMMTVGLIGCGIFSGYRQIGWLYVTAGFWALFMLGAFFSFIINAVVTDLWPERQRRGVLFLHSAISIGKIVGPGVAALMIGLLGIGLPWRGFFFFMAAITLTVVVLLIFAPQSKVYHSKEVHAWKESKVKEPVLLWLAAVLLGMMAGSETALATIAPTFYEVQYHLSSTMAAWLLAFHFIVLTAGRLGFGVLGGKVHTKVIVGLSLVPLGLILPAAYLDSPTWSAICFIAVGFAFSASWPAIFTNVVGHFSENRSRLTFAVGMMNAAGLATGFAATSWIFEYNRPLSLIFGPGLLGLCMVVFLVSQMGTVQHAMGYDQPSEQRQ